MSAKEQFEKLGYIQEIYENKRLPSCSGIQYTKKDNPSEMERVGVVYTKVIEFYPSSQEILITKSGERRDGEVFNSDATILSFEEFQAVQQQVDEFAWDNQ